MSRASVFGLSVLAAVSFPAARLCAQAVISTHSGLVHYFEGSVSIAGQPLDPRPGRFESIPDGAELRTAKGRAEVLLTPGVFLRIGENSGIRMVSTALAKTRVELLAGSAIVDSIEPQAGTSVTLVYKGWMVRQAEGGVYRIDSDPPRVSVREGKAEVSTADGGAPVAIEQGMYMPLAAVLAPEKSNGDARDALTEWADGRAESISADNAIAANIQDPASLSGANLPADAFTYYPMLGLSSIDAGGSVSPYGSYGAGSYGALDPYEAGPYGLTPIYQPGFYSLYLPGYTHPPLLLGLPGLIGTGLTRSLYSSPLYRSPLYNSPSYHSPLYNSPLYHTPSYPGRLGTPGSPVTRPSAPIHAAPHGVGHIGGHR
jgi:hypothetical protein